MGFNLGLLPFVLNDVTPFIFETRTTWRVCEFVLASLGPETAK
jgi:hypothetical protein